MRNTPDWLKFARNVSLERLMQDLREITQWERLSGSAEERRAFEYIRRQLASAGLRTQVLEHDALISLPRSAALHVYGPESADIPCITHSFSVATGPQGVEAQAIYVVDGAADLTRVNRDVRGRIAVVDGLAMPERVAQLQAAGAAGAVFLNRDPLVHEMIVSTVWGSPTLDRLAQLPAIPVVSTAGTAAERLRAALRGEPLLRIRIVTEVETGWRRLPLLVADVAGAHEDTYILVAGHVDSWYVGAMDNGAANAAMMEIGRLMAHVRPYRGLRLAFWSGHSHGRYAGSAWYADNFWEDLARRCVVHIYVDSIGGRGADVLEGGYCMPETWAIGAAVIRRIARQQFRGTRVGRTGDQSFLGIGIPSLFMTLSEHPPFGPEASRDFALTGSNSGGLGWWWHTPQDLIDKIDPRNLLRDAQIYAAAAYWLCTAPVLPLDYAAVAKDVIVKLRELQARLDGRFDLSACLAEARAFLAAARALRLRATRAKGARPRGVERINRALTTLGRVLIPVLYTRAGRFDHDPATTIPFLPPLVEAERLATVPEGSAEARALTIAATRGRNLLLHALRTAREIAEEAAR
ncbi:MAG: M28 family peptidase [Armatimonadota bacterium]|nr:M28 family peptidase [Armatimonadota bacterium]MDR7404931.1 M28 family peptidase [Armatimonadota bacterium]MDR7507160.1 M28 family peptidase [Armatimonadota bacterium]MDR7517086.1 M28 family peptidase [Armatimonadota bacterium]MDR7561039.1 M28 family peptidase [Armatimonadota bacterium]